jgi:hypothetical protein
MSLPTKIHNLSNNTPNRTLHIRDPHHLRCRTSGSAISDCVTTVTGPCDEALQEVIAPLEDWAASFQGLEKDPKTTEEESNWPGDEEEKEKPAQSVDRIGTHFSM